MHIRKILPLALCGAAAGAANGLFGAGGGTLLVPMLTHLHILDDTEIFPASVSIIAPICIISLITGQISQGQILTVALPYLIGSALGGIIAGLLGKKIPTTWLHRILGIFILWGGIRYLC